MFLFDLRAESRHRGWLAVAVRQPKTGVRSEGAAGAGGGGERGALRVKLEQCYVRLSLRGPELGA